MRLLVRSLGLLALCSSVAAAQDTHFSVDPFLTVAIPTAIYDKTTIYPNGSNVERLSLGVTPVFGVRLGYRLGGAWSVAVEGAYGTSSYRYHTLDAYQSPGGPVGSETWQWGSGDLTSLSVSVARRVLELSNGVHLDALALGGVHRLGVDKDPAFCPPPSAGGIPTCSSAQRWQRRYDVPSVGTGLAVSWSVSPRIGVRARTAYSLGRADTEAGFWTKLIPQSAQYEKDRSHLVQVFQLSAGVGIGL
jgi:hypothetical protein